MFGLRNTPQGSKLGKERFATLIGEATLIKGDLVLSESVRIDGQLDGHATRSPEAQVAVVVGPTGRVSGNITATRVVVAGTVHGSIVADEEVDLQAGAVVEGDLHCKSLRIEHGARLLCRVVTSAHPAATPRPVLVMDQGEPAKPALKSV